MDSYYFLHSFLMSSAAAYVNKSHTILPHGTRAIHICLHSRAATECVPT